MKTCHEKNCTVDYIVCSDHADNAADVDYDDDVHNIDGDDNDDDGNDNNDDDDGDDNDNDDDDYSDNHVDQQIKPLPGTQYEAHFQGQSNAWPSVAP